VRVRILNRGEASERELGSYEEISDFESEFLVAFHDICLEFIVAILHKQKVTNLEQALTSGLVDLTAISVYLEICGDRIIRGYRKAFSHLGGIDLTRVGIHTVYDRSVQDIVCKISFFR
jgi:hypothetical protein